MNNGHWEYSSEIDSADIAGFIYCITNKNTGQKYIGKKNTISRRTTQVRKVNSKEKKTKIVYKESDWKEYTGSSKTLNADIELLGKDNFKFEITHICKTKSLLNYTEIEQQILNDVLRAKDSSGNKLYYNNSIGSTIYKL